VLGYVARRLALGVPVLFGVSLLVFAMVHLVPGDPVSIMLGESPSATDAEVLRRQLGLDRPLPQQYVEFVARAAQGDLGVSIRSRRPVFDEIADRAPSTIQLTLVAVTLAIVLGVTAGVLAASGPSPLRETAQILSLAGLSLPTFWLGLLLILIVGTWLRLLPVTASGPEGLVLPGITLASPAAAVVARMTRSTMLETLTTDFVRTARAKGLGERVVLVRHVLRASLIPVVAIVGLQFGGLLAGSVIVESVFARPGIGRLAVQAILQRDFPLVQGVVLIVATSYVLVNIAVDLLYAWLDPRIRYA
jgi:ABC-type dipeptide/oligopeptide/nickel transport system permease component